MVAGRATTGVDQRQAARLNAEHSVAAPRRPRCPPSSYSLQDLQNKSCREIEKPGQGGRRAPKFSRPACRTWRMQVMTSGHPVAETGAHRPRARAERVRREAVEYVLC